MKYELVKKPKKPPHPTQKKFLIYDIIPYFSLKIVYILITPYFI